MENSIDIKFTNGYEEYLKLPAATLINFAVNELFLNNWFVQVGFSFIPPCPHRHYTFLEFVYNCGKNEKLYKRFIKN